jgi:hypothetical protein
MPRKHPSDDHARYTALKRAVLALGFLRRGTVTRRFMPCGKPGCACQGHPPQLHGPYYQWTRKVHGKTQTVRLTPAEAKYVEAWIANGRQLDRIVKRMERVSLRATARLLKEVPK